MKKTIGTVLELLSDQDPGDPWTSFGPYRLSWFANVESSNDEASKQSQSSIILAKVK
jgi:hypothetical protein